MDKFDISITELREGDLLVFRFKGENASLDDIECLSESLEGILPKGVTALILTSDGIEMSKIFKPSERSAETILIDCLKCGNKGLMSAYLDMCTNCANKERGVGV